MLNFFIFVCYNRNIVFSPDVPIKLDYQGKRVDMTHGPLPGLLMGLGQLNCSELRLKRLSNRHGVLGLDKLLTYLITEWLNDIKRNQLPSLLGGVGPMHSLVQLSKCWKRFLGVFNDFICSARYKRSVLDANRAVSERRKNC